MLKIVEKVKQSKQLSKVLRQQYNKQLIEEKKLESQIKYFFQINQKYTLNNIDEILLGITDPIPEESIASYCSILYEAVKHSYKLGQLKAELLVDTAKAKAIKESNINIPEIIDYSQLINVIPDLFTANDLRTRIFIASDKTMVRVNKEIKNVIMEAYAKNKGIKWVGKEVRKKYIQLRKFEAHRIARTEINSAQNLGMYDQYKELNVEFIQWITRPNAKTRLSHKREDNKIIRMGHRFANGLLYPGDKVDGKIEEWINCRCTSAPFLTHGRKYKLPAGDGTIEFDEKDIIFY